MNNHLTLAQGEQQQTGRRGRSGWAMTIAIPVLLLLAMPHGWAYAAADKPADNKVVDKGKGDKKTLVVYTNRKEDLLGPLLEKFEKTNKIDVSVYYGGDSLVEKIKQEGNTSPADIVITQNVAMVQQLKDAGLTMAVDAASLKGLPTMFIDQDKNWFGASYRARIIVVKKGSSAEKITSMKQLADDEWRGKICMRDGMHPYNLALFAQLRSHMDDKTAKNFLKKLKANLVQKPQATDRDQIKWVYSGQCDIAVVNSYYYGLVKADTPDLEQKVHPILVSLYGDKVGEGVSINVSGVAVLKNGANHQAADRLARFLLSPWSQEFFMTKNNEYPVVNHVAWRKNLLSLNGKPFGGDQKSMIEAYQYYPFVIKTLLSTNFNGG